MSIDNDDVLKAIEALIPNSLDEIIRQHRDVASLRLTTDMEVMNLYAPIIPGQVKELINDWRFITFTLQYPDACSTEIFLLGNRVSDGNARITSRVRKIDLDRGLVFTNSGSLYTLGSKGTGEPDQAQLFLVCAAFWKWGMGGYLGIMQFFY